MIMKEGDEATTAACFRADSTRALGESQPMFPPEGMEFVLQTALMLYGALNASFVA